MQGQVLEVSISPVGDELETSHASSATTIQLSDATDFDPSGGNVQIEGVAYTYTSADLTLGTLTLSSGLTTSADEGEKAFVLPLGEEKWAMVEVQDDDDVVLARVPHNLYDRMTDGVRDPEEQEAVNIELVDGEWLVKDLIAETLLVDGSYIDPDSTIPPEAVSDGVSPATSPIPIVRGLPRMLIGEITPVTNHDAVTYEWHISTSSAGTPTFGGVTAQQWGVGSMAAFESDATGAPLPYDTDYFLGTFSYDVDGAATFSGWSAAARLDPNGPADIGFGAVTAYSLESVMILVNTLKTAEAGRRIEWSGVAGVFGVYASDDTPLVYFPTDGSDLEINAKLRTGDLVVQGGLSLQGTTNAFAKNSSATLEAKTNDPLQAPTLSTGWPSLAFNVGALTSPSNRHGLFWYTSLWWTGYSFFNSSFIQAYDPVTGLSSGSAKSLPFGYDPTGGITHMTIGGNLRWVVLCQDIGSGGDWVVVIYNDSWVYQSEWNAGFITSGRSAHVSNDGTNVLIVQRDTGDNYIVYSRVASSGSSVGTTTCTTGTGTGDAVTGYYYGSADYGAARHTIVTATPLGITYTTRAYPFNTSGTLQSGERFYAATAEVAGVTYDGTNFYSLSTLTPSIYKHGNLSKAAGSTTYLVPFTNYDSDATGGTHETQMSAQGSKSVSCRQCLTVTAPPIPDAGGTDDPDSVRIYCGTSASRTSQWLQATPAPGTRTFTISNLVTSGTNPPSSNNFPDADAFEFYAADGTPLMAGDQSAPAEISYTPVWTSGGGSPNFGTTGSHVATYIRNGKMVTVIGKLTFGGTGINAGTGAWAFSVPLTGAYTNRAVAGGMVIDDASGTFTGGYNGRMTTATTVGFWGSGGRVGAATPQAPATGDVYEYAFSYFIA